ncbi:MAG: hypothetical protein KKD48_05245 [Nanoarchaeota archaeon]|nr:hypothetical protein [Nanoarchaeota archaeon]
MKNQAYIKISFEQIKKILNIDDDITIVSAEVNWVTDEIKLKLVGDRLPKFYGCIECIMLRDVSEWGRI